ncbi:hypothetical protein EVY05_14685, partial [Escherichia coli]
MLFAALIVEADFVVRRGAQHVTLVVLNEQAILKGQSTSSLLMPGLEIRVQGDDAPAVFRKGVLITGV